MMIRHLMIAASLAVLIEALSHGAWAMTSDDEDQGSNSSIQRHVSEPHPAESAPPGESPLGEAAQNVLLHIMSFLTPRDLANLSETSTRMRDVSARMREGQREEFSFIHYPASLPIERLEHLVQNSIHGVRRLHAAEALPIDNLVRQQFLWSVARNENLDPFERNMALRRLPRDEHTQALADELAPLLPPPLAELAPLAPPPVNEGEDVLDQMMLESASYIVSDFE